MSNPFSGREPQKLYQFLYEIFSIPRPSGHEEKIADYVIAFARDRGLEYITDALHNVLVRKKGSPGMEQIPPVLLEGHMDIVPIKAPGAKHDFLKDPVDLVVENGWVRANRTTLGADNGCAVAIMLTVLDDSRLQCPPLECLFTVQEETGLHGIEKFDLTQIKARRVIGLDAGAEGVFRKGVSTKYKNQFSLPVERELFEGTVYEIVVSGLRGGHASVAIPQDRACAIKLMGRILYKLQQELVLRIQKVDKRINRGVAEDCIATIVVSNLEEKELYERLRKEEAALRDEYCESDPDITIALKNYGNASVHALTEASGCCLSRALYLMPFGAIRRVVGRWDEPRCYATTKYVATEDRQIMIDTLVSTDKRINGVALQNELIAFFKVFGAEIILDELEFGWDPEEHSPIREIMRKTYLELFGNEPIINVSHGGNDCVVIKERVPEFDVVTTAATYLDYHTPNERLDMSSFEKVYHLIYKTLERIGKEEGGKDARK